MELMPTQE